MDDFGIVNCSTHFEVWNNGAREHSSFERPMCEKYVKVRSGYEFYGKIIKRSEKGAWLVLSGPNDRYVTGGFRDEGECQRYCLDEWSAKQKVILV